MASNKENVNKLDGNYFPSLTDTKVKSQYFFTVSIQIYHPGNLSKKLKNMRFEPIKDWL